MTTSFIQNKKYGKGSLISQGKNLSLLSGILFSFLYFPFTPMEAKEFRETENIFQEKIIPLFRKKCISCHNSELKIAGLDLTTASSFFQGSQSGPIFFPDDPKDSRILRVVSYQEKIKMPPTGRLSKDEISALTQWIDIGAPWSKNIISLSSIQETSSTETAASRHLFGPVSHPLVPKVEQVAWIQTKIDKFILSRLEKKGMKPSAKATKQELIRRATFDLTGLPPTRAAVQNFLGDPAPEAFEKILDRLLASPQYGERWARHWLDVARFGESQGFERDSLRQHAWRYRDYVINSFNRDKSYLRFVQEQIAGDVIKPVQQEGIIATSFLVAGPWDEVGEDQPNELMRARVREDELEDMVSAVTQTFLGLTVNCARCHDHKFDPVSQREYYRIRAALAGMRHGNRSVLPFREAQKRNNKVAPLKKRIASYYEKINTIEKVARQRVLYKKGASQERIGQPNPISQWTFDVDGKDSVGQMHFNLPENASIERGLLRLHTPKTLVRTAPLSKTLREKTLEVWASVRDNKDNNPLVMTLEHFSKRVFDGIFFKGKTSTWGANSEYGWRTMDFPREQQVTPPNEVVQVSLVYSADDRIALYQNGIPYGSYLPETIGHYGNLQTFPSESSTIVFGNGGTTQIGRIGLVGSLEEARLYDWALTPKEVAASFQASAQNISANELFEVMTQNEQLLRKQLITELRTAKRNLSQIPPVPMAYAGEPQQPKMTYVLERGDPANPREPVSAGGLSVLRTLPSDFGLPANAPEKIRRLKLAEWIGHPKNPLTSRVMVNRVWHYHFGKGIIETPNDFGVNGGRPSHPKLLDWLTAEFQEKNWSLKKLHKLIMLSSTYQQSSGYDPIMATKDTENRLMWRFTPRRLEAEAIRDAMLAISGQLNSQLGGPSFRPFSLKIPDNTPFYEPTDPVGPQYNRRTVYRMNVNSGKDPLLENLDCPDPSTKTPRRSETTTPLQALSLMNNSFVLRQAKLFAKRIKRETGTTQQTPSAQVATAYQLAFGRSAEPTEINRGSIFVTNQGLENFCWVLLNSNEFKYLE